MSRAARESEQARAAKARLRVQHYEQVTHNASLTCRFFGISSRRTHAGGLPWSRSSVLGESPVLLRMGLTCVMCLARPHELRASRLWAKGGNRTSLKIRIPWCT